MLQIQMDHIQYSIVIVLVFTLFFAFQIAQVKRTELSAPETTLLRTPENCTKCTLLPRQIYCIHLRTTQTALTAKCQTAPVMLLSPSPNGHDLSFHSVRFLCSENVDVRNPACFWLPLCRQELCGVVTSCGMKVSLFGLLHLSFNVSVYIKFAVFVFCRFFSLLFL